MKNSTERTPVKPLNELLADLQDSDAVVELSEKIDRAFQSFESRFAGIASHREFVDAVAGLVKHLYQYGLPIPRTMTYSSSLSEGLDLLNRYYESSGILGFDAAFLDATDKDGTGPEFVLRQLSEIIKEREVRQYLNYRYLLAIDPTDRVVHRWIVERLIEELGPLLPDDLRTGAPDRFAKYYRNLLEMVISSDVFFTQIRNSAKTFSVT
jgi:hypothetical protein